MHGGASMQRVTSFDSSDESNSFDINGFKLTLLSRKGSWCLGFDGSIGKTYLYNLFLQAQEIPEYKDMFLGLTYEEIDSEEYVNRIKAFTGKYVILDRFDLYFDERIVEEALKNDRCVFVVLKNEMLWNRIPYRGATIEFDANGMIVEAL